MVLQYAGTIVRAILSSIEADRSYDTAWRGMDLSSILGYLLRTQICGGVNFLGSRGSLRHTAQI